jgi:hypothetical protein
MRYRFTGTPGWSLVDVSNSGYNPSALAEDNVAFDTGYDDMISHRVVTDASNVAVITPLVNKDRHSVIGSLSLDATQRSLGLSSTVAINLARTPQAATRFLNDIRDHNASGEEVDAGVSAVSRYNLGVWYRRSVLFGGGGDNGTIGWSAWL